MRVIKHKKSGGCQGACCLNVKRGVSILKESLKVGDGDELKVCGAYYRISDGAVEFFD